MSTALVSLTKKTGPKPMQRFTCVADGCREIADHPVSGLCHMHYARVRRTGTTVAKQRTRGTGTLTVYGYIAIAKNKKKTQEHIMVAEKALGRELPKNAEVHHVNGIRSDNTPSNLVVCPSKAYHKLIHQRMNSLSACGNPSHRKCPFCKTYSAPETMTHSKHGRHYYHVACKTAYVKNRRIK